MVLLFHNNRTGQGSYYCCGRNGMHWGLRAKSTSGILICCWRHVTGSIKRYVCSLEFTPKRIGRSPHSWNLSIEILSVFVGAAISLSYWFSNSVKKSRFLLWVEKSNLVGKKRGLVSRFVFSCQSQDLGCWIRYRNNRWKRRKCSS